MPTLAEGEARTIIVNPSGPPSNTLTAVLPPGVTISLESVLAAIDASGAGDTTATLEIADSSGAVIARKAQGQVVTGGVVGSATWALRLGDETSASAGGPVQVETIDDASTFGSEIFGNSADLVYWTHASGDTLLDLTDPQNPVVIAAGLYTVMMTLRWTNVPGPFVVGKGFTQQLYVQSLQPDPTSGRTTQHMTWDASIVGTFATTITLTLPLQAGDVLQHYGSNGQNAPATVYGSGYVVKQA